MDRRFTQKQVLMIHKQLFEHNGGNDKVLDYAILSFVLWNPFQTFNRKELDPTIQEKAPWLEYGLIKNRWMEDVNKRIGTYTMLCFLPLNDIELQYTQKELYEIILGIAARKNSQIY